MPLTKPDQRLRRRARARVVQALYAWEATHHEVPLPIAAGRMWDDLALGPEERRFAEPLLRTLTSSLPDIDRHIAALTHNWRPERIGAIERAVLRLGAAELMSEPGPGQEPTPPLAAIHEAVVLAERFGSDASARFVNGVLDALGRKLGRI